MIKYYTKTDIVRMIEDSGMELTYIDVFNLVYMIERLSSFDKKKLVEILLKIVED